MAQVPTGGNYVVDNSTGANVRADINEIFDAILTVNSGSSGPSYAKAYTLWADTSAGTMKIRNGANNAWIELFQLDGTLTLEDGSNSAPALAFRDDLDTGIYSDGANTFNVATAGVERMQLGATTIFNETGADVDFRIEGDTQANLFYVDAGNDRIGIGTSTPQTLMHLNGQGARFQITNSATGSASGDGIIMGINGDNDFFINHQESSENILFFNAGTERARITHQGKVLINTSTASTTGNSQYSRFEVSGNSSSATGAGHLTIKAGTTTASQTNGNTLGRLIFSTLDGGDYAYIQASIDGAMGSSDFPGRMMFFTCADGSGTATERMRIDKNGDVGIGMTPSGMRLDVQSTANDIARFTGANSAGLTFRNDTNHEIQLHTGSSDSLIIGTDGENERMRIDSAGRVIIGTTAVAQNEKVRITGRTVDGSSTTIDLDGTGSSGPLLAMRSSSSDADQLAVLVLNQAGLKSAIGTARASTGNWGTDLRFYTHKEQTQDIHQSYERMRITANGEVKIGTKDPTLGGEKLHVKHGGSSANVCGLFFNNVQDRTNLIIKHDRAVSSTSGVMIDFIDQLNTSSGKITSDGSSTTYSTSSDYRLKENAVPISDGITRLKTLKPYRFNFKVSPTKTVDGFFAHEVTAVPEAISGEKDAMQPLTFYEEGDTIPSGKQVGDAKTFSETEIQAQTIDQSKLVPLLVAAVQELITKVETLEAA